MLIHVTNGPEDAHKSWMVGFLPSPSGILADAISIASSSLQEIQSISLTSLLQYPLLKAVVRSCSVKKICKIHKCFLWRKSFPWTLRNFKRNFFLAKTYSGCFFCLHYSRSPILILYVINWHLRRECLVFFYGGAKDFIFKWIFLRIISIFIKI